MECMDKIKMDDLWRISAKTKMAQKVTFLVFFFYKLRIRIKGRQGRQLVCKPRQG